MKKLAVIGSALLLVACGSGDDAVATDAPAEAAATTPAADDPLVGNFGGTTADGKAWTSAMSADGTYQDTLDGEVAETGTWTHEDDQVCFTPAAEAGSAATGTCLTLLNVNDDGSLVMADAEGTETTVPRLPN